MRYKLLIASFIALSLTGCQGHSNLQAVMLTNNNKTIKVITPKFLNQSSEVHHEEENKTNVNLQNTIVQISNPSELLVTVNKINTLPPDYVPEKLIKPNIPFYFSGDSPKRYLRDVASVAVEQLFEDAYKDGIKLVGVSGYRSYKTQQSVFTSHVNRSGYDSAITFSAQPGHSEHQTGLALDVSTKKLNYQLTEKFGSTKEGIWLAENAHKYGFIIRYPRDKTDITGYQYEPWHIRYVGAEAAKEIYENNWTLENYQKEKTKRQKIIYID